MLLSWTSPCLVSLCRGQQPEDHRWVCGAATQRGDPGASRASGRQRGTQTRRSRGQSRTRRSRNRCSSAESSEEFVSGGPQILLAPSSSTSKHTLNYTQYVLPGFSHPPSHQAFNVRSIWLSHGSVCWKGFSSLELLCRQFSCFITGMNPHLQFI